MRMTRSIFGMLFAVALTLPIAACDTAGEETFEETPAAEERTDVHEENGALEESPMDERNM